MAKPDLMRAALELSRQALPRCLPNPPVGCVIVGPSGVVSRGYTGAPGEPHAEAAALAGLLAPVDTSEMTAFVTLEPCSFHGRTPSCAQALIDMRIVRVVVGILDPDPRNNGKGLAMLREAGIQVELGVLRDEVRTFLAPYLLLLG